MVLECSTRLRDLASLQGPAKISLRMRRRRFFRETLCAASLRRSRSLCFSQATTMRRCSLRSSRSRWASAHSRELHVSSVVGFEEP
jgi:hypothetical protein